jgi:hypothetical protein
MQQAACDWVFDGVDDNWKIVIQHGTLIQTGGLHTCTQTGATQYRSLTILPKIVSGALPTKFIIFDSDTPLTNGQTVCSHNTDDTGTRQPPSGDISTWWTGTNFGCSNDRPSMWTFEANWSGSGGNGALIQAGPYDVTTNLGPSNVVFKNAEFRIIPFASGSGGQLIQASPSTDMTQVSQQSSNWHFENIYLHGDAKDWCNAVGGITQYSVGAKGSGYVKNDTGTINTGSGTAAYKIYHVLPGGLVDLMFLTSAGSSIGKSKFCVQSERGIV